MLYNQQKMRSLNLKQKKFQILNNNIMEKYKAIQQMSSDNKKSVQTNSWANKEEDDIDAAPMFISKETNRKKSRN